MSDFTERLPDGRYIAEGRADAELFQITGAPYVLRSELEAEQNVEDTARAAAEKVDEREAIRQQIRAEMAVEQAAWNVEYERKRAAEAQAERHDADRRAERIAHLEAKIAANDKAIATIEGTAPELAPLWQAMEDAHSGAAEQGGWRPYQATMDALRNAGVSPKAINDKNTALNRGAAA